MKTKMYFHTPNHYLLLFFLENRPFLELAVPSFDIIRFKACFSPLVSLTESSLFMFCNIERPATTLLFVNIGLYPSGNAVCCDAIDITSFIA